MGEKEGSEAGLKSGATESRNGSEDPPLHIRVEATHLPSNSDDHREPHARVWAGGRPLVPG
jgi:hypothetical protein